MAAKTYLVINGPMPTTAAPASVATGTAIKTLLQLKPGVQCRIVEWGISFDGQSAAVPGKVELLETGNVGGTVTAFAAADVMPNNDSNATANSAGTSGIPLNLGTTHSGYTCTSEGSITAARMFDSQLISPTNQYVKQFPLGREPELVVGNFTRIRVTFPVTVNAYCYIIFEV